MIIDIVPRFCHFKRSREHDAVEFFQDRMIFQCAFRKTGGGIGKQVDRNPAGF